jgi:hypothetical protein
VVCGGIQQAQKKKEEKHVGREYRDILVWCAYP